MWVWGKFHRLKLMNNIKQILKKNCYDIFEIEPQFAIDTALLSTKLHQLQKEFHPDNAINNELSTNLASAHINNCYTTLKNPLNRSIALLEVNGYLLDLAKDTQLPLEFLGEQMELHELIDEANGNISALEELEQTINDKQKQLLVSLSDTFINKDFQEALNLTKQLGFYTRLLNSIADKINE